MFLLLAKSGFIQHVSSHKIVMIIVMQERLAGVFVTSCKAVNTPSLVQRTPLIPSIHIDYLLANILDTSRHLFVCCQGN